MNKNRDVLITFDKVDERVSFIDVCKWGRWLIYLLKRWHIPIRADLKEQWRFQFKDLKGMWFILILKIAVTYFRQLTLVKHMVYLIWFQC